jgi:type IX secretion system PorP/SprF family membrane protein
MRKILPNKNITLVLLAFAMQVATTLHAQDQHFSQFYNAPLIVNPALTGVFDGKFRLSNIYRSQWSGLGEGYKTIHVSADAPLGKGTMGSNFFGIGLLVSQDKAGEAGFTSTIVEGSLSYTAGLSDQGDQFLSIGFQAGLNQQSLDLSKATWDEQWTGDSFDPSVMSGESIQLETFSYLDFNAGLNYYYAPDGMNFFNIGASMSHVGSPNVSFFLKQDAPLTSKITVHSSAELSLDRESYMWLLPKVIYMNQGPQNELMFGGLFKNKIQFKSRYTNYQKEAFFYVGGFYRWADAVVINARFEYNSVGLGISYDTNVSSLSSSAASSSAFEINFSYVTAIKRGQRAKNYNKMPKFF